MVKRISIINFKGGVGKTTTSLHLATGLSKYYDKRVLIVDVDHQSSLSLVCLDEATWDDAKKDGRTVNAIFTHFTVPGTPLPDKSIIIKSPMKKYPKLDLLSSELQLDETELDLGSSGMGDPFLSEWNKRMLIAKWLDKNKIDDDYDYIIFDCPPATKIVTQNALAASHGYIIPTIPDAVSTRGIPHLIERVLTKIDAKMIGLEIYLKAKGIKIEKTYVPKTAHLGIIIFRIRTHGPAASGYVNEHTINLGILQRKYGNLIITPYIEEGIGVTEAMGEGDPVYDSYGNYNVRSRGFINTFKKITAECKQRIDAI